MGEEVGAGHLERKKYSSKSSRASTIRLFISIFSESLAGEGGCGSLANKRVVRRVAVEDRGRWSSPWKPG